MMLQGVTSTVTIEQSARMAFAGAEDDEAEIGQHKADHTENDADLRAAEPPTGSPANPAYRYRRPSQPLAALPINPITTTGKISARGRKASICAFGLKGS